MPPPTTHAETTHEGTEGGTAAWGASLLEATLATSIAGVHTTAAVPSMNDAMTEQRRRSGSGDLFATFNLARAEAIRRGSSVALIPADARDWSAGCKAFADRNDNGVHDAGEETILERQPAANGVSIRPCFGAARALGFASLEVDGWWARRPAIDSGDVDFRRRPAGTANAI